MRCPLAMYCHCSPLSHELKVFLIFNTSQNVPCRYFNILSIVRKRIFVNSCVGDRGDWRPLLLFMSILQLLAGLCSQLTKEQKKTDYSPQLQASSWAASAERVLLLAKKIIAECLAVPSCTERSRNVMMSLINSSKEHSKC